METMHIDETLAELRIRELIKRVDLEEDLHEAALQAINWNDSELTYHNRGHMLEVAETTVQLCEERQVPRYLTKILLLAALWHDADYRTPLQEDYLSKEHRSAELAHQTIMYTGTATNSGQRLMIADRVATLIISTKEDHTPSDIAEEILNEADLGNLSGDKTEMLRRSGAIFIESLLLNGESAIGTAESIILNHMKELTAWCSPTTERLGCMIDVKFGKKVIDFAVEAASFSTKVKTNIQDITPLQILRAVGKN